jgi:tetratricopeptide (TPR) repeat protein
MGIKGDVRSISLANVLQDLAMNEQTGTLTIRYKGRQLALWFERGALRLVGLGSREGPSLLNGLLALEKIRPDETPAVTGKRTSETGFIRSLLKKGRVSREDLKAALEHQMGEHLCDAFLWPDATFEFEEGEPDDRAFDADQLDYEPRLAVDAVIMEALRRADEWGETRKAILSSNEILVPDPQRLPPDADGTCRRVFGLLDGERSLRDIQELTRLGEFVLLRGAALLMRGGAARPLSAAEAFERARARAGKKEWEAALRMARYGLDHERKNLGLLELALRCCEALEDHEGAASYARQLASAHAESGQLEAAIKSYQKVLAHAPRDLTAHERLFAVLLQLDLKLDALAQGEALAGAYKKAGLPDKAMAVYQRLLDALGDQPELLESLAEIQRHLGDKAEAVKLYGKLLGQAMEAKNDSLSLDYCRTILRIDPRHAEALRLREQLETGEIERARRRRRLVRSVVAVLGLSAGVCGAAVYEYQARGLYSHVRKPFMDAMEARNFGEALRQYDAVIDGYRWSLKAREIRDERFDVEERYAKELLGTAERLEGEGQLTEAIRSLEDGRGPLRRAENRGKMDDRLAQLRVRRADKEKEWTRKLSTMDPAKIPQEAADPLAVPALTRLLGHADVPVRAAAVQALRSIRGEEAVGALLQALADPDPGLRAEASAELVGRGKTPFRASLAAGRPAYALGESIVLEWRLANLSPAEVELTLEEAPSQRLEVRGPDGKPCDVPRPKVGPRSVRLGPGEFVGGAFPEMKAATAAPGRYQFSWAASVTWNARSIELRAPPVSVTRASR